MAGALFGEGGVSLFVAGAALREILKIAGARHVAFFHTKCVSEMGRVRSPKRRVRDDNFMVGLSSDHGRIMLESSLYFGGSNSRIFRSNLELRISWQAQYLVRIKGDFTCSAHCKSRFLSQIPTIDCRLTPKYEADSPSLAR